MGLTVHGSTKPAKRDTLSWTGNLRLVVLHRQESYRNRGLSFLDPESRRATNGFLS